MKTLIIDNQSQYVHRLKEVTPGELTISTYNKIPEDFNNYNLVILTGSSGFPIIGNEKKLEQEISLIKRIQVPLIGICYGAELIAYTLGAKLSELEERHRGMETYKVLKDKDSIFSGQDHFQAYENHHWQITNLPDTLTAVAKSDHSLAMFKHNTRPIYGLQFHPEHFTNVSFGDEIYQNIIKTLIK